VKILFTSHEVAPYAKVGGLADVAGSLPKALKALGHDVRILMPAYQMVVDSPAYAVEPVLDNLPVQVNPVWSKNAFVKQTTLDEVPVYLLGTDEWFCDTDKSESVYLPGSSQHLFFARATFAMLKAMDWIPDVLHCNDWHTGMIPVILREDADAAFANTASVFTIHNLAYQGEFPYEIVEQVGLNGSLFNMHQLETYGAVNFLKSGCVFAEQVNTVSPKYAKEIQTSEFGCRLEGLMAHLATEGRLSGILNGLDQHEFNPEIDPAIPAYFSAADTSGKKKCKQALLEELHMAEIPGAPLMGVVSRLSSQKGMDMLIHLLDRISLLPAQVVVQGLGEPWLAEKFRALQQRYPYHFRFIEKFDAPLAQRVYAGSDIFLMPSAFEPCGLGQLIAMRYGTIPVVRETGGLANTVHDGQNGFTFVEKNDEQFLATIRRAVFAFGNEATWSKLVSNAMHHDSRWEKSALQYVSVYEKAHASVGRSVSV
jgi:starch synthase